MSHLEISEISSYSSDMNVIKRLCKGEGERILKASGKAKGWQSKRRRFRREREAEATFLPIQNRRFRTPPYFVGNKSNSKITFRHLEMQSRKIHSSKHFHEKVIETSIIHHDTVYFTSFSHYFN